MQLRIAICSDSGSWINRRLPSLITALRERGHLVTHVHQPQDIAHGDICFLLSCFRLIGADFRARNRTTVVVHESSLPKGRGWSPMTWQVLEGQRCIPLTLFEAVDDADAGPVYLRDSYWLTGYELVEELRDGQYAATQRICLRFVDSYPSILSTATPQVGEPTHYPRRRPEDSRVDPDRTLREQFDLLRVVDNDSYPAFFEIDGRRYVLRIERQEEHS